MSQMTGIGDFQPCFKGECFCSQMTASWHVKRSHVYVVGFAPHPEVLFLKVGKANDTLSRLKSFNTHLPGGPSFMWAVCLDNEPEAFAKEKDLMLAMDRLVGSEAVGGEWFSLPAGRIGDAAKLIEALGAKPYCVDLAPAAAYSQKRRQRSIKKRQGVRERREQMDEWRRRALEERSRISGVAGVYGGTLRG